MKGYCELCGEYAPLVSVIIDGIVYKVCEKCAVGHRKVPSYLSRKKRKQFPSSPRRKKSPSVKYEEYVVQNAGEIIRHAREKKGLTRDQLAPLVGERSSTIARIERGDWIPPIPIARKFERALGIELVKKEEIIENNTEKKHKKERKFYLTIGDVLELD